MTQSPSHWEPCVAASEAWEYTIIFYLGPGGPELSRPDIPTISGCVSLRGPRMSSYWLLCPESGSFVLIPEAHSPHRSGFYLTSPFSPDDSYYWLLPWRAGSCCPGWLSEPFLAYNPLPVSLIVTGWDLDSPDKWTGERSHAFTWCYI